MQKLKSIIGSTPFVIAEIGQNHNGDVYHAVRLMGMADRCGVQAFKFQARDAAYEFTPEQLAAPYVNHHSYGATYGEHRAALDLKPEHFAHLKDRHRYNGWEATLLASVQSPRMVAELERIDFCPAYKIASKDLLNHELIEEAARTGKPVLLSTGLAETWEEIRRAIEVIRRHHDNFGVFHCVSVYPCQPADCNLRAIDLFRAWSRDWGCPIGWSDHTGTTQVPAHAAAMGYDMIEVHVTLSRMQRGTDHAPSLEETGLRELMLRLRITKEAEGVPTLAKPAGIAVMREKNGYGAIREVA